MEVPSRLSSAASACSTQWTVEIFTADCISSECASVSGTVAAVRATTEACPGNHGDLYFCVQTCVVYLYVRYVHACGGGCTHASVKRQKGDVRWAALSLSHSLRLGLYQNLKLGCLPASSINPPASALTRMRLWAHHDHAQVFAWGLGIQTPISHLRSATAFLPKVWALCFSMADFSFLHLISLKWLSHLPSFLPSFIHSYYRCLLRQDSQNKAKMCF